MRRVTVCYAQAEEEAGRAAGPHAQLRVREYSQSLYLTNCCVQAEEEGGELLSRMPN